MTTIAVNKYKEPFDIYIGRGSIWGNPFSSRSGTKAKFIVATREEAVLSYASWIITQKHLLLQLRDLKGKRLGCFCKPQLCHGDILAQMAEDYEYWEEYSNSL